MLGARVLFDFGHEGNRKTHEGIKLKRQKFQIYNNIKAMFELSSYTGLFLVRAVPSKGNI